MLILGLCISKSGLQIEFIILQFQINRDGVFLQKRTAIVCISEYFLIGRFLPARKIFLALEFG